MKKIQEQKPFVDYHLQPILNNAEQIELDSTLKNIFQIKPQQIVKKSNFFKSIFRDGNLLQTISSDKKYFHHQSSLQFRGWKSN
jgi:hypothetical protein